MAKLLHAEKFVCLIFSRPLNQLSDMFIDALII